MANKIPAEGKDGENATSRKLRSTRTVGDGESSRGQTKRTMKYNQGVRETKQ